MRICQEYIQKMNINKRIIKIFMMKIEIKLLQTLKKINL